MINFVNFEALIPNIMKRYIFSFLMLLMTAICAMGADRNPDVYKFDSKSHDFGTIKASNGPVSHTFMITNTGNTPLVITTVTNGGCGCTTPKWTPEPIAPGKTGKVTIKFDPTGRRGEFNREVRARIETTRKKYTAKLNFSGVIVP